MSWGEMSTGWNVLEPKIIASYYIKEKIADLCFRSKIVAY